MCEATSPREAEGGKEPRLVRELIARCRNGEEAAMRELVDRFRNVVFGVCLRMLSNRHDAEDVAQETFLRAFRSLSHWDDQRDFQPWLLAIAANRCRTWLSLRKSRAKSVEFIDDVPDRSPSTHAADALSEELHRALATVREEYRRAFLLFHEQELSYLDIAELMQVPLGTIKTWVHRARREIIEQLQKRGVCEVKHE